MDLQLDGPRVFGSNPNRNLGGLGCWALARPDHLIDGHRRYAPTIIRQSIRLGIRTIFKWRLLMILFAPGHIVTECWNNPCVALLRSTMTPYGNPLAVIGMAGCKPGASVL
jgi:hypothetical protein